MGSGNVSDKLKELGSWVRDYISAIQLGRLHPFTLVERKARAATRNEPWGPTGVQLNELTALCDDPDQSHVIFAVLEYRLKSPPEKWRCIYKALQVLEFLVKRGCELCCSNARLLLPKVQWLSQRFDYTDLDGKDYGTNIRIRSTSLIALLEDEPSLARARRQLAMRAQQSMEQHVHGTSSFGRTAGSLQARPQEIHAIAAAFRSGTVSVAGLATPLSSTSRRSTQDTIPGPLQHGVILRPPGEPKGSIRLNHPRHLRTPAAMLRELLGQPTNKHCADCRGTDAAARPSWASINCGVFLCMRCAGIHRGLGVHVSKVRSCTLDTWQPEQVSFMASTGNQVANAYWEALVEPGTCPPSRDGNIAMEKFIRNKYTDRQWALPGAEWPEAALHPDFVEMAHAAVSKARAAMTDGTAGASSGTAGVDLAHGPTEGASTSWGVPGMPRRYGHDLQDEDPLDLVNHWLSPPVLAPGTTSHAPEPTAGGPHYSAESPGTSAGSRGPAIGDLLLMGEAAGALAAGRRGYLCTTASVGAGGTSTAPPTAAADVWEELVSRHAGSQPPPAAEDARGAGVSPVDVLEWLDRQHERGVGVPFPTSIPRGPLTPVSSEGDLRSSPARATPVMLEAVAAAALAARKAAPFAGNDSCATTGDSASGYQQHDHGSGPCSPAAAGPGWQEAGQRAASTRPAVDGHSGANSSPALVVTREFRPEDSSPDKMLLQPPGSTALRCEGGTASACAGGCNRTGADVGGNDATAAAAAGEASQGPVAPGILDVQPSTAQPASPTLAGRDDDPFKASLLPFNPSNNLRHPRNRNAPQGSTSGYSSATASNMAPVQGPGYVPLGVPQGALAMSAERLGPASAAASADSSRGTVDTRGGQDLDNLRRQHMADLEQRLRPQPAPTPAVPLSTASARMLGNLAAAGVVAPASAAKLLGVGYGVSTSSAARMGGM